MGRLGYERLLYHVISQATERKEVRLVQRSVGLQFVICEPRPSPPCMAVQ
jgi:hypothetical protein